MDIAPGPVLRPVQRDDDGMTSRLEMLERMRVLGIFATPDVSAGQAYAQLRPFRSERETFLAAARARRQLREAAVVLARFNLGDHEITLPDMGRQILRAEPDRVHRVQETASRTKKRTDS